MSTLLEKATRYLPVIMLITAVAVLLQIVLKEHLFSFVVGWTQQHHRAVFWTLVILAAGAWTFAGLAYLRRINRVPRWLTKRKALMDILDRLSNRQELERRMSKEADAIYIDAEARQAGRAASARDLVRSIEESVADTLIEAKRKGAQRIVLVERDGSVCAEVAQQAAATETRAAD
jgi:hypothetical protein